MQNICFILRDWDDDAKVWVAISDDEFKSLIARDQKKHSKIIGQLHLKLEWIWLLATA